MDRAGIDVNVVAESADAAGVRHLAELGERLDLLEFWATAGASRSGHPEGPDDALARACDAVDGVTPVPVLVPPTGLPRVYDRVLRITRSGENRVVRLCPATHEYPLLDWIVSPIPELCVRHGLALMLDFDDGPLPWGAVVDFARRFPSLPLILLGADAARDCAAPAALDHTPNLLVATSSGDISQLVVTFGPNRFVWGAGASEPAPAAPGLHESVLHGNARALAAGDYAGSRL